MNLEIQPHFRLSWRNCSQSVFLWACVGGLLTWAALPPVGWWPLAWLAPGPWLLLVKLPKLPGRRPYASLYLAGVGYWLLQLQWMRLPHWSTSLGWVAISLYLGVYLPAFVALARVAVGQWRVPLVLAGPIVFTGLEYFRSIFLTGFALTLLGHSQSEQLAVIQIADLGGAYAVSFLIMLVAAAGASAWGPPGERKLWPLALAGVALAGALGYGVYRLQEPTVDVPRGLRVALIQGNLDTIFGDTEEHIQESYNDYYARTLSVAERHPELDVIVWPESMFSGPGPSFSFAEPFVAPPQVHSTRAAEFEAWVRAQVADDEARRVALASRVNGADERGAARRTAFILGAEAMHFTATGLERYNSAQFVGADGGLLGRYEKMHPVMFGEYVPLGKVFPWLYKLTPMGEGLTAGRGPQAFAVGPYKLSPSICFETIVPHLIRAQVVQLERAGQAPDFLVNVTNDGWFWGSSLLDLHLRCGVFRAVETRRPLLIAANTGFSAVVDGNGRVLEQGPRRASGEIVAEVKPDGRRSPYLTLGDWPWAACLVFCAAAGVAGWFGRGWNVNKAKPPTLAAK